MFFSTRHEWLFNTCWKVHYIKYLTTVFFRVLIAFGCQTFAGDCTASLQQKWDSFVVFFYRAARRSSPTTREDTELKSMPHSRLMIRKYTSNFIVLYYKTKISLCSYNLSQKYLVEFLNHRQTM